MRTAKVQVPEKLSKHTGFMNRPIFTYFELDASMGAILKMSITAHDYLKKYTSKLVSHREARVNEYSRLSKSTH